MELPDVLGWELWQQLRHIRDWLETSPAQRPGLFPGHPRVIATERRAEAELIAPELHEALDDFSRFMTSPEPAVGAVLRACETVVEWARDRSLSETGVQFSAACVRIRPDDPRLANLAALCNRRAGRWADAEVLDDRAAVQAREQRNPVEYIGAHLGMAALWNTRGSYRRAYSHLIVAINKARRSGRLWLAGHAEHDLMLMLTEGGDYEGAEEAAERAVHLYALHDRRFPFLAADFALVQIYQQLYANALPLLDVFLKAIEEPPQQVIGLSMLGRALAALGRRDEFRAVQERVALLIGEFPQDAAVALYHLGEGARAAAEWNMAAELAGSAHEIAVARGDDKLRTLAAELMRGIHGRTFLTASANPDRATARQAIMKRLAARLARWKPTSNRGRKRTGSRDQWAA
jgi:tetratricopeptide (TPR) repeat protein